MHAVLLVVSNQITKEVAVLDDVTAVSLISTAHPRDEDELADRVKILAKRTDRLKGFNIVKLVGIIAVASTQQQQQQQQQQQRQRQQQQQQQTKQLLMTIVIDGNS